METKLVLWTYDPAVTASDAVKADHVDYVKAKIASGDLLAAGPRTDVPGGVFVYRAVDAAALDQLLAADPFTPAGLVAQTDVVDWNAGLGLLATAA